MSVSPSAAGAPLPLEPAVERAHLELLPEPVVTALPRPGAVKRALDLTIAVAAILLLLPVLALVALLVATSSRGPVLFRQVRVGVDGVPFVLWKFRSMYRDAERQRAGLLHRNEGSGPLFKVRDDPRVTPVGRVLRRTSLDELPQLLNVLNGTMSLVGPRPALPEETARLSEYERGREAVRPGLTGLAQVSGRSDLSWDEAVALDLHYVRRHSLRMDLSILLRTLPAVLARRGAY